MQPYDSLALVDGPAHRRSARWLILVRAAGTVIRDEMTANCRPSWILGSHPHACIVEINNGGRPSASLDPYFWSGGAPPARCSLAGLARIAPPNAELPAERAKARTCVGRLPTPAAKTS